jgi:hypothetical protein
LNTWSLQVAAQAAVKQVRHQEVNQAAAAVPVVLKRQQVYRLQLVLQ